MNNNHCYYDTLNCQDDDLKALFFSNPKFETQLFNDSDFIFSKDSRRQLNDFVTQLNNNVIVMGTSGCGKTTRFVDPNIRQAAGNIIASDPKGSLVKKHGRHLEEEGYNVYIMDFQHPEWSVRWNTPHIPNLTPDLLSIPNCCIRSALLSLHTVNDKIGVVNHTPISYLYRRLEMRPSGFFANFHLVIIVEKRRLVITIISPQIRQDKHKRCVIPAVLFYAALYGRGHKQIELPVTPDKKFDILLTAYQIGDDLLQTPLNLKSVFDFSMTEKADCKCIHTAPRIFTKAL